MEQKSNLKTEYTMVILMAILWGFIGLNRIGIAYLFPTLIPLFHMNYFEAGLLLSGTSILWAIISWVSGNLGDRYGKKKVFVPAMIFAGIMAALMGAAGGFASLLAVRGLIGVGDGVGASVGFSMIAEGSAPVRRGLNQGIFSGGYTVIGAGLGAIVVTRLSAAFGWRWVFPLVGLGTVIMAIIISRFVVDAKEKGTAKKEQVSPWEVFKYRPIIFLIIINCFVFSWLQLSMGFNTLFLTTVRHFSPVLAGSILAGWGIVGFLGQLVLPGISDFIGRRKVIVISALISGIAYWIFFTGALNPGMLALVISICGFFGWGQLSLTTATAINEVVPERMHATAIGVVNFFGVIIGGTIMPAVGGLAAGKWGLSSPLMIAATLMILVAVFMVGVPETAPRKIGNQKLEVPQ